MIIIDIVKPWCSSPWETRQFFRFQLKDKFNKKNNKVQPHINSHFQHLLPLNTVFKWRSRDNISLHVCNWNMFNKVYKIQLKWVCETGHLQHGAAPASLCESIPPSLASEAQLSLNEDKQQNSTLLLFYLHNSSSGKQRWKRLILLLH